MEKPRQMRSAMLIAALAIVQTAAMAQSSPVTVAYGPDVASVPTLSEWGMIVMAVVLAVVAVIAMRRGAGSKAVLSIALAAMVSFGALSEFKWLGVAWANGYDTFNMTSATGGQLSVVTARGFAYVNNNTPTPQRIISITPQYLPALPVDDKPGCVPGLLVAPGTACALRTSGDA